MNEQKQEIPLEDMNFETRQNLVGFFDLLLKIDKRNNPENYQYELKNNSVRYPFL